MRIKRQRWHPPEYIFKQVREQVQRATEHCENIDYLTFVPDGEPTLDINLGREIELLKTLGIKTAVITNASLIWRESVRRELSKADWISIKIDAVQESIWRKINRPHGSLDFQLVLDGIREFSDSYPGELTTETMLISEQNDQPSTLQAIADFIAKINPHIAYLAIPTRPPAEKFAVAPPEQIINESFQIFDRRLERVEYLVDYEGDDFAFTGDVENNILSITAVHPMREDAMLDFLNRAGSDWSVVRRLLGQNLLTETVFEGNRFYLRKLCRNP
jgi:wyosine [tRNA(Phe)-imidazoG37] synthetase (radical SAM superfamily)